MRFDDIVYRPIDSWPGELTPDHRRRRAPFGAEWYTTTQLLERELAMLDARQVLFQVALEERDFRIDGKPRAQAKASHPGVVLAFESKYGPIKFAVDTFTRWQDNVRAIALGMEALRKVDRYGVTKHGEQYTGWKALPSSTDGADSLSTVEQARAFIADRFGGDIRRALFETHPGRGGDPDDCRKVLRARELLA